MRSLREAVLAHLPKCHWDRGCLLWQSAIDQKGYGRVQHARYSTAAHRAVYEVFVGPIPDGMHVLHSCDVRACVNPFHLRCGTHADNMADKVARARQSRQHGETHGMAKLSDEQVREIRARRGVETGVALAQRFGVSRAMITLIQRRQNWRHLA